VIPSLGTGGTERLVTDLVTHLDPGRFNITVCSHQDGLFGQYLARQGYRVHLLTDGLSRAGSHAVRKLQSLGRRVLRLRDLAARERIDIIHTHHLGPLLHALLAGLGSRRWRLVHTEHIRPDVETGYPGWLVRCGPWMFPSADVVTGVSDAVGAYFREEARLDFPRVRVIYNGVDVDEFAGPHDGAAKRAELGISPQDWVIGMVGSLRPQKNHQLLLRAFARLFPSVSEARLVLAGDGELRRPLETLAAELGIQDRVHFLGPRSDVAELLSTFDLYCLPSHYEGMPLTVFEAMAAGVPIVATRVVGIREVVRDGETGLLVPPNDPNALAQALMQARRNPRLCEELSIAGRQYVDTHAHLKNMVGQYADLYEQVVTGLS
jgi:glycosyltransferase involved in cell wall biosynthesis